MQNDGTNATIIERQRVNDSHWIIRVAPDEKPCAAFIPGQYAELGIPDPRVKGGEIGVKKKMVRRLYSIASSNTDLDYYEFYIAAVPSGAISPELVQIPEDGRLFLGSKPRGKFTINNIPDNQNLVMITTGTGIAPIMSIFRSYVDKNRWKTFTVIHGVRYAEDLGYRDELQEHAKKFHNFFYIPAISRENAPTIDNAVKGRVIDIFECQHYEKITGLKINPESTQVFICGNPVMIETMGSYFKELGLKQNSSTKPGQIHFERYW